MYGVERKYFVLIEAIENVNIPSTSQELHGQARPVLVTSINRRAMTFLYPIMNKSTT